MNKLMQHGKKAFVYKAIIKAILECKKVNIIFVFVFFELLEYLRPILYFRLRRRGKIKYKVPIPIKTKEQYRIVFF
jgi:ribosomal protein S7